MLSNGATFIVAQRFAFSGSEPLGGEGQTARVPKIITLSNFLHEIDM